jgi:hypothetical protein
MDETELRQRKELARLLLAAETIPSLDEVKAGAERSVRAGLALAAQPAAVAVTAPPRAETIPFPDGLAPTPQAPQPVEPDAALPGADVLIVTWTAAEADALADVFTPGTSRRRWQPYRHRFDEHYRPQIRPGAPSLMAGRLGSWTGDARATLPVKDLFLQLIAEAKPDVVLTIGTAGGVAADQDLGDAIVSRAAKFRLADEFANEEFNGETFRSDWQIPRGQFTAARKLMEGFADRLVEPAFAPPTKRYPFEGPPVNPARPNRPNIKLDGDDFAAFHPILTTDFFEFGTSGNKLDEEGCAVEMGDAVLGLAAAAQHLRPGDQRRSAEVPEHGPGHAGALGGLVLRGIRLLDKRQRRAGHLGHRRRAQLRVSRARGPARAGRSL